MSAIKDLLQEAFQAGQASASAYEHGAYAQPFSDWYKENVDENDLTACNNFEAMKSAVEEAAKLVELINDMHKPEYATFFREGLELSGYELAELYRPIFATVLENAKPQSHA